MYIHAYTDTEVGEGLPPPVVENLGYDPVQEQA